MSTIRDEFEAWVRSGFDAPDDELILQRNDLGGYRYVSTNQGWLAYQAATERAAKLCETAKEDAYSVADMDGTGYVLGMADGANACAAAIRAKGGEAK